MIIPNDISKAILITHANCMDGCGCAIMFLNAGGKRENIVFVSAGKANLAVAQHLLNDNFLILADVSVDVGCATDLEKRGNAVIIDHHQTALHLSGRSWCKVSMESCATVLLRQYLVDHGFLRDMVSTFGVARLINDHDMWLNETERSSEMALFQQFVGPEKFIQRFTDAYRAWDWEYHEQYVVDLLKARESEYIKNRLPTIKVKIATIQNLNVKVGYFVAGENISKLLSAALEKYSDIDVAAAIDIEKNSVSLRSRKGGTDVSIMAKKYGGGGHKSAAGHPLPCYLIDDIFDEVH